MNTKSDIEHTDKHTNSAARILILARSLALFPVVMAVILFMTAGRLDWTWAWVYLGINLANAFIAGPIALRTNSVTVAENEEPRKTENWDVGSIFYLFTMYIVLPIVAGLDVRFDWTQALSVVWHIAGTAIFAVGLGLPSWVMITNPFIWSDVPIQPGQTVYTDGPYRIVRHPAYTGLFLQAFGVPILLGSLWALVPGIPAAVCIIIATSSEDRILQAELPGYVDYARKVRFRLIPGIW